MTDDGTTRLRPRRLAQRTSRARNAGELIYRLFAKPVSITLDGQQTSASTLEAILLQLMHKELAGDRRALRVRLQFEALAHRMSKPKLDLMFLEDPAIDDAGKGHADGR